MLLHKIMYKKRAVFNAFIIMIKINLKSTNVEAGPLISTKVKLEHHEILQINDFDCMKH